MSDQAPRQWTVTRSAAAGLFLLLLLITAFLVVISFPVGTYTVFFTHLSEAKSSGTTGTPFLWLGPVAFLLPITVTYGGAFLAATLAYVAMFVLALAQGRGALSAMSSALHEGVPEFFSNRALLTLIAIGFLVFTAGILDSVVASFGAPIGNPFTTEDPLQTMLGFTLAPLREEFGFRVLLVGVAAMAVSAGRPLGIALKALWRPSAAYEGATNTVAMAVVFAAGAVSAGIFGACHVACGGGWDIGKLPEAVYGGVFLSVLYIRYGFHVAVLAHWGIDYLSSVFAFFGQGAFGIPWLSEPGYSLQQLVSVDVFFLFGIASTLAVSYVGIVRLVKRGTVQPPDPA